MKNSLIQNQNTFFYILMVLAMAGWGASWVNAKVLSSYINEYELIFLRNFFTIVTLVPVLIFTKKYFKINLKSFLLCIVASIIMIAYMKYYFLGTKFGTASLGGSLVTTLIPINTYIIMRIFFKKESSKKDIFALFLAVIGVFTMINVWNFNLDEIFAIENIYFLYASVLWALLTIVSSKITDTSPMVFTLYMYLITSAIVLTFFMDISDLPYEKFDGIFWLNILSLAFVSTTFATTIYFVGIEKLGAKEVSTFIFLVPFFAILFSYLFLGEAINLSIIVGTSLTIFAVAILNNIISFKRKN